VTRTLAALVLSLLPLTASAQYIDRVNVYGIAGKSTTNWHGQEDMQSLNFEIGHAFTARTEAGLYFAPVSFWQPRSWFGSQYHDGNENVHAFNLAVMGRHHWNTDSSRLQFYAELGTGPMYSSHRVPAATSHFNFVSSGGAGVTLFPASRHAVMLGYRFEHISNGGSQPRNPGLNVHSMLLGFSLHPMPVRVAHRPRGDGEKQASE
jgi:hypothetical protein